MGQNALNALLQRRIAICQRGREVSRGYQPHGHRFSVPDAVAADLFDCVRERVAQVQRRPHAFFKRVLLYDVPLYPDRLGDQRLQAGPRLRCVGGYGGPLIPFQPLQQAAADQQAVLHHLGHTGRKFSRRQCAQRAHLGEHGLRLLERAHQILALGQVHAGLAADAGVDHGQQRGGTLNQAYAPHIRCRDKAGDVSDDAAPQGHNGAGAIQAGRQ